LIMILMISRSSFPPICDPQTLDPICLSPKAEKMGLNDETDMANKAVDKTEP